MSDEAENKHGVPAVARFGDMDVESFDIYYPRWPTTLANFPKSVVREWVYRHWNDFKDNWLDLDLGRFVFSDATYTNQKIMAIDHVSDWLTTLDYWGDELFRNDLRRSTWLARYILEHGTTPEPIIVAVSADGINYKYGGPMKVPLQLIEGHMRLAYLRGMIRHAYPALQPSHRVWNLVLPVSS